MKKPSETSAEQRLLTVSEAAKVLGVKSANTVYKLIAEGHLPTIDLPIQGGTRIDTRDLDAFLERRKNEAS